MKSIDKYLQAALKEGASDLHFLSGDPVRARVHGVLRSIMNETLTIETVQGAMSEIMTSTEIAKPFGLSSPAARRHSCPAGR